MNNFCAIFRQLTVNEFSNYLKILGSVRTKIKLVDLPEIGRGKSFRRIVHFPEEYTVKPLEVTNLGGRDPKTGRKVVNGIGGGIKHKYHWIEWKRFGPKEGPPKIEKVLKIIKDGCRTAYVALVGDEDKLKYYLATQNMKEGDLIKTSSHIPRIPVRPNEGDAYPLGALPIGTEVNCIESYPGLGGFLIHAAGCYATIVRKDPNNRVVIKMPSRREYSLPHESMCTVGRLSNVEHADTPIGSAQANRWLGNRPRSGLWQRKTGRFGRKIKWPKPMKVLVAKEKDDEEIITFTAPRPFVKTLNAHFHNN